MGCMHGSKSGQCQHGCGIPRQHRERIPPANEKTAHPMSNLEVAAWLLLAVSITLIGLWMVLP